MKKITSLANPDIKRIRSLNLRKYREEAGVFVTEGLRHALAAAEAGWQFDTLAIEESVQDKPLVQKLLKQVEAQKAQIICVPHTVMESLTRRDNAQSVIAVLHQQWQPLSAVKEGLWVALEEIRDPGNLGTIMRTCDASGASGIVLIGHTCDPYSLEAIRASMGSFPEISLVRCSLDQILQHVYAFSLQVVGTHLKTTHDYRQISYQQSLLLVMGNEQAGLTEKMAAACTHLVKIPMQGKADSLNVSVATALMLYEINRGVLIC